ncbi:MAG: TolC family protein, partial [Rickettsiales bacterium]|nr:TolC family protein [Rickettsiales bacterium]
MQKLLKHTKILASCSLILYGTSSLLFPGSAHSLSIKEALEATYAFNPTIKAEIEAVKSTAELGNQARSGWLPTVSYRYERSREGRDLGGSISEDMSPSFSKQLDVVQPIFSGFSTIYGMKQARNQFESAKENYRRVEQNVMFNAVTAYMDLVRDNEVLKLNENNERVLQKHLQVTQERFKLGEVTRTDVAQAQARLAV